MNRLRSSIVGAACAAGGLIASLPAHAEDLHLTLQNTSSIPIIEFYTSPADVGDWEEDVFGDGVLMPDHEVEIVISDGRTQCAYDIRIVTKDGEEYEDRDVDLCETGIYTFSD